MKRKLVSLLCVFSMAAAMLSGCGIGRRDSRGGPGVCGASVVCAQLSDGQYHRYRHDSGCIGRVFPGKA